MFTKNYNRLLLTVAALCTLYNQGYSQDKNLPKDLYIASAIPDSLKEDANVVVRYEARETTIKDAGKQITKEHSIVTILNDKGDDDAILALPYNRKYDSYTNIELNIYNASGTLIKKYRKSDMYDGSASNDETIVTDDRYLAIKHTIAAYPTTVEIIFEENESSFISLNSWYVQDKMEQAVQNEYCKISVNPAVGFRFKATNTKLKPEKGNSEGFDTYTWSVKNLKAIKKEENVMSWNIQSKISFATDLFNCYGYPGTFNNWQAFGNWIKSLNDDVCTLTPERIAEVKKMTDTIKTDKEKARFLYNYMQKSMRYVSIQLGIGGYKPFPATFVDQKKYGDCKALSNYMRALLSAVNIPSNYAIIKAGYNEEPADFAFPNNTFNHAILCIPFKNDTTWLECTSNTTAFGKLGPFTENRNALLITDEGGKLVNTPKSSPADNQFNSYVHLILDADGGAKAQIKVSSNGQYRSMFVDRLPNYKTDEQKEYLIKELHIKQPSLFEYTPAADKDGFKDVTIDMQYDKFCDIATGDKQFYRPQAFMLWSGTLPAEEKRRSNYYFNSPMLKTCVTTIDLPAGFEVEALPTDQSLKFSYGTYEVKYKYDAAKNQVISTAKFNLTNQVIPAAKYTEMQVYMDAVAKAQNKKLVIHRKA
ncbi:DUF3857 domain-containing protein [Mucilaginibacter sabulilitoris]|uniref:DUF3857 domain-containing protein n=1 Tax=Mucilaginibacter sabulilitoris TaxID=1173583 RepID=A0ABZ0TNB1_9SPHI|nr:DUF3857 domain-containing protein [Mucilaginibacter sabulilitoris]WPU94646.1 DUF3857 domain-containing protein [Mucilaginibacter sabulilitoris]